MKDWQTAQPPLNPLDPTPLNYFSFFFSMINVVLSFSFHFTYVLSAFVKAEFWDGHLIFIVLLIHSLFYSSSIRYFCGYSLKSHNFKTADSINFKLVAFICIFFWHMQTMFSSVVKISGLCFLPNRSMKYNLFSLLLIIHQGAVPSPSRPSLLPGWLWLRRCYLKKVYRKKKGFPSLINKGPPSFISYDSQILKMQT